jgi:hypothetical protein
MLSLSIIVALEDPFVREAEKDDKMHSKLLRMTGDPKPPWEDTASYNNQT